MLRFSLRKRIAQFSSIREKIQQERTERLKNLPTTTQDKIRNFGIIAHIDAGKTTTTERMLFYAGAIPFPGEVHDGTTTMDFMPQERQRGITIRSAAISFSWEGYQYNLIDTPGHIDFTAEVERSLRVLDGAVAIFDGVSGVQTQSETVWLQANKFNIPKIAFINKMDRQGASLDYTIESMKQRLNIKPFIMQIPVGECDHFNSVIDLVTMKEIGWVDKYGSQMETRLIDKTHRYYEKAVKARDDLLSTISEFDEKIAELYLDDSKDLFNQQLLLQSIRKTINQEYNTCCPVYVGSALKNRGVQPILEAIHELLPEPSERPMIFDINDPAKKRKLEKSERLTAYIYKVIQDQDHGQLGFTRVYSGEMQPKMNYQNSTKDELIKVQNIYRVRANRYVPINSVQAGDIIAIQTKQATAGSTIISASDEKFVLSQLQLPQCVFFANLEYESAKDKPKLDQALQQLQLEDDSLKITTASEGTTITIGGQGELHLEIIVQRLKEDFGLNTQLKKVQVEYKETISEEGQIELKFQDVIKGRPLWLKLTVKLEPIESQTNELVLDFDRDNEFDLLYKQYKESQQQKAVQKQDVGIKYIKNPCKFIETEVITDDFGEEKAYHINSLQFPLFYALEQQIQGSLNRGFLKGFQMHGIRATILDGHYTVKRTTELAIGRAVQKLMADIAPQLKPIILEPIMDLEISCPTSLQQKIINDLISQRRGKIIEIEQDQHRSGSQNNTRVTIKATIPSQETIGYSTSIRSITQGEAYFTLNFKNYDFVGGQKQNEIINSYY